MVGSCRSSKRHGCNLDGSSAGVGGEGLHFGCYCFIGEVGGCVKLLEIKIVRGRRIVLFHLPEVRVLPGDTPISLEIHLTVGCHSMSNSELQATCI